MLHRVILVFPDHPVVWDYPCISWPSCVMGLSLYSLTILLYGLVLCPITSILYEATRVLVMLCPPRSNFTKEVMVPADGGFNALQVCSVRKESKF